MAKGKTAKKELSIVMPAFNEEANIERTVTACFAALAQAKISGEVVVTNDGSRDRTGAILKKMLSRFPALRVVNHEANGGYGEALRDAILAAQGKFIVSIDSDGQFDIADMRLLICEQKKGFEVVTGYRTRKQDSPFKVFADRVLSMLVKMMFAVRFRDTNCALKLYSPGVIDKITIEARGYQVPTEILLKLNALGVKIGQVPVRHFPRQQGQSALHPWRTGWQMVIFLFYLRLKLSLFRKKIIKKL